MTAPSRRLLLGSVAGLTAAVHIPNSATASPNQDAELIAIGAAAFPAIKEYLAYNRAFHSLPQGHPDLEPVAALSDPSFATITELTDRAIDLRATTAAGIAAKALLVQFWIRWEHGPVGDVDPDDLTADLRLGWSMLDDILNGNGVT